MDEILRREFLLVLIILIVSSFIVIPAFSEGTQIWTEDEQGNPRTDFEPDENVYIRGSGFNPNAQIDITITRPDNVVENYSTSSDENGCFLYIYTLDGMEGIYYVTATDGINSASTTFEDCLRILEGYDKAASRWERGLIEGWKELDWVPYRIKFRWLPEGESNYNFNVYHNNLLGSNDGVDALENFHVADENGNTVEGAIIASGPFYKAPGKDCDRDIYYKLSVTFTTPSPRLSWYVYWQAHLALGSSGWPGAKLHAYTDITGCQDVPIKVPPVLVGSISGSKWNDLDRDGVRDPSEPGIPDWTVQLYFFDPFENTWIHLADENTNAAGDYTFGGLVGGDYYLAEVLQGNWIQTCPPTGTHSVTLLEGENRGGLDFGNFLVARGVEVSISPSYQSGLPGSMLTYAVTATNTGTIADNYDLNASDTQGWNPTISPSTLSLAPGESGNATLSVAIPSGAVPGTNDDVTVVATSRTDPTVSASDACVANAAIVRGVKATISPDYQSGPPGATLAYSVIVKNVGNVADNYVIIAWDNKGWLGPWTLELIDVPPGENRTKPLNVTIPDNAVPCTRDNIVVRATSQADNMVSAENSAIAHAAAFLRKVKVSLTPTHQENLPGATLNYIVVVANEGDVVDNYALRASDNENWGPTVTPSSLAIAPGTSDNATLSVVIPENAWANDEATIVATATSTENAEVSASDVGVAKTSVMRGVDVSISPSENKALPGENTTFIVTITNTGNVEDTYDITTSDNAGWDLEFGLTRVKLAPYGSAVVWNLIVTVPENVEPGTEDVITVVATSQIDNTISDNDNCIAAVPKYYLRAGWNIISFWDVSENDTPANLFAGVGYTMKYYVAPYGPFKEVRPDQPVELGVGYLVKVDRDWLFETTGVPPENYTMNLVAGWQIVGFPVTSENTTPANLFAGMTYTMKYYVAPYGPFKFARPDQPVELGRGYLLKLDNDKTVTIPL